MKRGSRWQVAGIFQRLRSVSVGSQGRTATFGQFAVQSQVSVGLLEVNRLKSKAKSLSKWLFARNLHPLFRLSALAKMQEKPSKRGRYPSSDMQFCN
jgi:hypothetical protein